MGERRVTADGRILEKMPDGTIVEVGRQQAPSQAGPQGAIPIGPRNPVPQQKANLDVAEFQWRQQQAAQDDARKQQAMVAEMAAKGFRPDGKGGWVPDASLKPGGASGDAPGVTAKVRADALKMFSDSSALTRQADKLSGQYREGPGQTSGVWGIGDYFPTDRNKQFDDTAEQTRGFIKGALGYTGGEGNTIGEAQMNYGPYLPNTSDFDGRIKGKISGLYELGDQGRQRAIATLGGVPDEQGNIHPIGSPEANRILGQYKRSKTVWDEVTIKAPDITAAPPGSDKRALPYPPGFQEEYAAYMAQNMNGNMDPAAYAAFRNAHAQKYGYGPQPAGYYEAEAQQLNDYYNQGGRTIGGISPIEEDMTTSQMINNALANNPLSVAAMNAGDAGSGGLISAVAGDKVNMLNQANPNAALVGQIGGAILGAEGTGAIGRATLGKLAPMLMRGGRGAALGRGLAADATYSGVYGANTGQDPFESALLGGAGSLIGRGVGKATGAAIGGVSRLPAPAMLNRAGVPTTVGQNLGGIAKRVEDRAMSMPVIGDMIAKRRMESFNAFNRAAQNEAGAPIGAQFDQAGNWTDELPDQFEQAYNNATAGAQVPLDAQFYDDLAKARAAGQRLPPDLAAKFDRAVANRVDPIANQNVYYHGSDADIIGDIRPSENGLLGPGIYFTPDKSRAAFYAGSKGESGVHARAVDGPFANLDQYLAEVGTPPSDMAARTANRVAAMDKLRAKGFNGIEWTDAGGFPSLNVINPSSVRLAGMSGPQYQQAMRGLKGYKAELSKPGFEADYRDALGGVQDALRGQMVRGGGDSVASGLAKADEAYRMGKVVQDAQRRAINGSGSGEGGIFTPAQLNTAAMGNLKKFGGNRPFAALADAGQEVLPSKIPDSGTAGRLSQLLLPTALGGAGYAANGTEGLGTAGGLMALLALGATKRGQKGLNKLLFDRPDAAKALGAAVRKKQGLFGAASIPLLLESQ